MTALYTLKGYGRIEPGWMRECFRLFKTRGVNIRKLVLMKNGQPDCFSMLELQFAVGNSEEAAFLPLLESQLSQLKWISQTLNRQ